MPKISDFFFFLEVHWALRMRRSMKWRPRDRKVSLDTPKDYTQNIYDLENHDRRIQKLVNLALTKWIMSYFLIFFINLLAFRPVLVFLLVHTNFLCLLWFVKYGTNRQIDFRCVYFDSQKPFLHRHGPDPNLPMNYHWLKWGRSADMGF